MRFYPPELGNILDLVIGRIQLDDLVVQLICVRDGGNGLAMLSDCGKQLLAISGWVVCVWSTTYSTILNQTCLSRYQGICGLADIVAAILESPLT